MICSLILYYTRITVYYISVEKTFDVETFLKMMSRKNKPIETKDISSWLGCTVRHIQKWCQKNNVKYHLTGGRKYYIWNEFTLKEFQKWYNRNLNKPKKKYYIPVQKNIKVKQRIEREPYLTTRDILTTFDIEGKPIRIDDKIWVKTQMRYIQKWCKNNEIPFEIQGKRRKYLIPPEMKSEILKNIKTISLR